MCVNVSQRPVLETGSMQQLVLLRRMYCNNPFDLYESSHKEQLLGHNSTENATRLSNTNTKAQTCQMNSFLADLRNEGDPDASASDVILPLFLFEGNRTQPLAI